MDLVLGFILFLFIIQMCINVALFCLYLEVVKYVEY